jgi:hypothetical protein
VYAKGNYFHAFNINFRNNFGTQQNIASLAFAVQSSKYAALFGCQIHGNQDTLSISGYLFAFKTYIEGNVDFIYGSGSAYFLASTISPNEDGISITASKRTTNTTAAGFVFDQCTLKPAPGSGRFTNVGLGRPWNSFSRVAYIGCYFDSMISAAGWNQWSNSSPQTDGVLYGEYHNSGSGSSICSRAKFSRQLSDTDVVQFQLGNFFASTSFIDLDHVDTQPFSVGLGSAQVCSTASSSISSPTTPSTSIQSSLMSSTPAVSSISNSLPLVTVYSTTTLLASLTASTTISGSDVKSTTFVKSTETILVTGSDAIKTSTQKATTTISAASPDVTSTSIYVVTQDDGLTLTPDAVIKTSVIKTTTTEFAVVTKAAKTSTVQGSTTITAKITSGPKPTTVTQSEGSIILITSLIYPKGASTTVRTTISNVPSSTKTTTIKSKSSITVTSVSFKTTTKTSTSTQSCVSTAGVQHLVRRGAIIPRAAAGTTTIVISTTLTSYVKTLTATQGGSTALVTQTSVATKSSVLPGSTSTQVITAIVATHTDYQPRSTAYVTITSISKIGKTTTLKASTSILFSTSLVIKSSLSTVTAEAATISEIKTRTISQTFVAEQQTVYITKSSDVTSIIRTTLPASTSTKYSTIDLGGGVKTETVTAPPGTKTVVNKITQTAVVWTTKTAKGCES